MEEVKAKLKFLRISPRKVRLVVDLVRGKKALRAVDILTVLNKKSSELVKKLLQSAIANAKNNFGLSVETLKVEKITVDEGPTMKRWMPRARGRATEIKKRTSHINIVLTGKADEQEKKEVKKKTKVENKS